MRNYKFKRSCNEFIDKKTKIVEDIFTAIDGDSVVLDEATIINIQS